MHILVVSQYFWPENFRINDLCLGLIERGHQVTVLTGLPNYPSGRFFSGYGLRGPRKEMYQGVRVLRVPMIPRGRGRKWQLALNYLSYAFSASILGPFLCREHYDCMFTFQTSPVTVAYPGIVLKFLKRVPLILWVQDLWPESLSATGAVKNPWILNLVRSAVRWIYRRCDEIWIQSQAFENSVREVAGKNGPPVRYFPNWAEVFYKPEHVPADASERAEFPSGFRLVYAGNIGLAQDFNTLLAAAEILKSHSEIKWVVLGDGVERDRVRSEIDKRGLKDCFYLLGSRANQTMPRYLSVADAVLAPLRDEPTFAQVIPSKIQSYMAVGKPIIAVLKGEGARVVEDAGAGITSPPGDAQALAKVVLELASKPASDLKSMGDRGRRYFEANFERDKLIDQFVVVTTSIKNRAS